MADSNDGGTPPEKPASDQPPPPRAVQICVQINHIVGKIEAAIIVAALAGLVLIGFYRSLYESTKKWFERAIFPEPPIWSTPTILLLVFVIGMVGLSLAAQSDKLINIDIFSRVMKPRMRLVVRILNAAFGFLVCYYLIRSSLHTRKILDDHETAGKLLSDHVTMLIIPITLGLVMLHLLLSAIIDVAWLSAKRTPPPETRAADDISPQTSREGGV